MAAYKAIKGHTIETVAGDPGTIVDGLIWYDSVARKVQGSKTAAGAWASGGNLGTARYMWRCWNSNSSFTFWWCYTRCH